MKKKSKRLRTEEARKKIRNRKLCKKYKFLKPWRGWRNDRETYGWKTKGEKYSYIMWDFWYYGWNNAFGDKFLAELGDAVNRSAIRNSFHIYGGKEKWGRLVLEYGPFDEEIDSVITKYEEISKHTCYKCGRPNVPLINYGWIIPVCRDCFNGPKEKYHGYIMSTVREDFI